MTKNLDFAVYIGRFQPLHVGHEAIIRQALLVANKLILLVGSANVASDMRNPFTYEERKQHITDVFHYEVSIGRVIIKPIDDVFYDDATWNDNVRKTVVDTILKEGNPSGVQINGTKDFTVALAGFSKDETSNYLNDFKDWTSIRLDTQYGMFNASDIREAYFNRLPVIPETALGPIMQKNLRNFMMTAAFRRLVTEHQEILHVAKTYGKGPFLTSDAIVTIGSQTLLIKRAGRYGNGLWAMPGGLMEPGETIEDSMLRELNEETRLCDLNPRLTKDFLRSCIVSSKCYGDPKRDLRGHYVSNVFRIDLPADMPVPLVQARDDAAHAAFVDFSAIDEREFFADHYAIIAAMKPEITDTMAEPVTLAA